MPGDEAHRGRTTAWVGFTGGAVVSVAANVAHAKPTSGARIASGLWPLFLLVAFEVIVRVHWQPGARWAVARYVGASVVAGVAAVMSYRHMAGLLGRYGEDSISAHLGPLAVDGLMVVSGVALLCLTRTDNTYAAPHAQPAASPTGAQPAQRSPVRTEPAQRKRTTAHAHDAVRVQAEQAYRQSVAAGAPLTGTQLAARFGRSPRWGQQLKAALDATRFRAVPDAEGTAYPGETASDEREPAERTAGR